jgi:hypothetical protein
MLHTHAQFEDGSVSVEAGPFGLEADFGEYSGAGLRRLNSTISGKTGVKDRPLKKPD